MSTTLVKHPLSLYDFMGYFIPGLYTTWLIFTLDYIHFYSKDLEHKTGLINLIGLHTFFTHGKLNQLDHFIVLSSVYVIFAFIIGQLLSILSNIIIEELPYIDSRRHYFANALGEKEVDKRVGLYILPFKWCDFFKAPIVDMLFLATKVITNVIIWLLPLQIFLLPFLLLLSPARTEEDIKMKLSYLDNFFGLQPLSEVGSKVAIGNIRGILLKNFKVAYRKKDCTSYFHYIYHYALEKCDSHLIKFNNYVALYGFMRNMLMGNIILFYFSVWAWHFGSATINLVILFGILNVLYLYGYLKFIRRYTEEIIFAACAISE